jgi:hypothetical protein
MALDVRKFGPKSDKIGAHRGAFVYQETFKKDSSTASRVINEVVLEGEFSEVHTHPATTQLYNQCGPIVSLAIVPSAILMP